MSKRSEYFLASASSNVQLELLKISHPSFSQDYFVVRNSDEDGITVTIDGQQVHFTYYPMRITALGNRENLDSGFRVEFGDLGEVLPKELDNIALEGTYEILPTVVYWTFESDDLTEPLFGPLTLEVEEFSFTKDGVAFEAKAPSLNVSQTGEVYSPFRFPMLRGF